MKDSINNIKKKSKRNIYVLSFLIMVLLLVGVSYAYIAPFITENNKTETKVKTKELNLVYTGIGEINFQNIIAGDSFKKIFSVENISNEAVNYSIYMENVVNQFNSDLVYTLEDEDGVIVSETALPATKTGKTYIKNNISLNANESKIYTLTIMYKYAEDRDQSINNGKIFKSTLGIESSIINNSYN